MVTVGDLLREWRHRMRISQLELALAADVSQRHVSLVETGRSTPSASMVLRLATELQVPLRERNHLLLAAGHAPQYGERPLDRGGLEAAYDAVTTVLRAREPYPAIAMDRRWNIVLMNRAVEPLLTEIDPELLTKPLNWVRLGMHPRGLAPHIVNLAQVRTILRARLSRQLARTRDPEVAALYEEFLAADPGDDRTVSIESEIVIPMVVRLRGQELRLFSTITTFGTAQDITLEEISIESYYPADAHTAELFPQLQSKHEEADVHA